MIKNADIRFVLKNPVIAKEFDQVRMVRRQQKPANNRIAAKAMYNSQVLLIVAPLAEQSQDSKNASKLGQSIIQEMKKVPRIPSGVPSPMLKTI